MSTFASELREIPFSVNLLPYCDFFHIGKSKEFLQNFHTITHASALYDFRNFTRSNIKEHPQLKDAFVYNTLIDASSINLTPPVFIEGCHLNSEIELEGENILTGIPKDVGSIKLKKGICLTCIPVYNPLKKSADSSWTSIIYGIEDSFKYTVEDDECRFLNTNFSDWMKDKGMSPTDLWEDNEQHELWNARLFPVSDEPEEAIRLSLTLQTPTHDFVLAQNEPGNSTNPHSIDQWRAASRVSLQEVLDSIDYDNLLGSYFEIEQKTKLRNITRTLTPNNDLSSEKIISWCHEREDYVKLTESVKSLIEGSDDLLFQARLYKLLSNIPRETNGEKIELGDNIGEDKKALENKAFELIGEAIGKGIQHDGLSAQNIQIRSDEVVWVCAPARLDFAGGWSDTPPYCLEHGGSVLNAAVKLNGQYPIQVIGKLHPEPFIKINSIDLGERIIVSETSEILSYQDPTNWTALPKAAFVVTGIIPEETELNLQDILKELGGGIDLTLFSAVPSGSGLGTSSILGSAIIACLSRMSRVAGSRKAGLGQQLTQEDLFNRTLYMEQLMTTGGGWQDQIGGVVGGVKHITTEPGLFQVPRISWTDLKVGPNMDLSERFLLYYTGYRRMAKNILRNILIEMR
jgi:galactokinase/mevalonate kinase-like predicted kinase